MKIIIFNTLYYPNFIGGAEKSVQNLADGYLNKGHDILVVSTTYKADYSDIVNGVRVHYINTRNIYWGFNNEKQNSIEKAIWHGIDSYNFFLSKNIRAILENEKPDIVHTNNISGFSVNVWKIISDLGIKIVHTLRDYHLLCPNVTMYKNGKNCIKQCSTCKIYSIPKKKLSSKVNALVGISDYILEKHLKMGYFPNITLNKVIGNNVGNINSKKKDFNPEKIVFGFIGQLSENKGIDLLLAVFNKLNSYSNWTLIIAGKGDEAFTMLLKNKYRSERITFMGVVKPEKFYSKIDVLVVPSLWQEPYGRVVVEGIRQKKMVIGSKRGGIIDLLPEINLFEPNESELTKMIVEILEKRRMEIIENYREIDMVDKYLTIFNNIIDSNQS